MTRAWTRRPRRRTTTAAIGGCLAALAVVALVGANASHQVGRAHGGHRPLPFLSSAGSWTVDAQGRVVVLHGVDIIRKVPPYYPATFTAAAATFLAAEGFTSARIGALWTAVEPAPGRYNDGYIAKLVRFSDLLNHAGLRTLLDFHQDLWSEKYGGDGAPAWASLGASPDDAFRHFWADDAGPDGVGLQEHFAKAWAHVARAFASRGGVIGFDPFNEPYPGSGYALPCSDFTACAAFEAGPLATFYRRVDRAIRHVDGHHPIYVEGVADNGQQVPSLPHLTHPAVAFTFHYYCSPYFFLQQGNPGGADQTETVACTDQERHALDLYRQYATRLQEPTTVGEFSAADTNTDNARMVDLMGQRFLSWDIWHYDSRSESTGTSDEGLLVDNAAPGSEANAKQPKLNAIVVPYPTAIAGTPRSYRYDRASNVMRLSFATTPVPGAHLRSATSWIFVPPRHYPSSYRVAVSGARIIRRTHEWLGLENERAAPTVTVTITGA